MKNKNLGSVLLILGTSIGAGMIALPVAAAEQNIFMSFFLLCFSWGVMTLGALMLLEANLWLGAKSNYIAIAGVTLGRIGQIISWFIYLVLMYALLCAYIGGTSDVVHVILNAIHFQLSHFIEIIIALALLAYIIMRGINSVDLMNRILMFVKLAIYVVVIGCLIPHLVSSRLTEGTSHIHFNTLMVMMTSFGYATILPTLVDYVDRDHKRARNMVLIGSLIPLFIYILWIIVIQSIIPRDQLIQIAQGGRTVAELLNAMQQSQGSVWLVSLANVFMSICAVTSFLGVSLSLVDFLADGIKVDKKTSRGWIVYALTFIPPVIIVLIAPGIFIKALSYAGICCLLLLVVIPAAMVLSGRHLKKYQHDFRVPGGASLLLLVLIIGMALVVGLIL